MELNRNYAGIAIDEANYASSRAVILPVPYDGTSTWGKGADKGPDALLEATENMELYDIETQTEVVREGIHIHEAIAENDSPESMVESVRSATKQILNDSKLPVILGGEHSVSIGAIQACAQKFPDLAVLHIDAHADLRKSYQGSTCNHACAVHWASQNCRLVQVGIRSMDISELPYIQKGRLFTGDDCYYQNDEEWQQAALDALGADGRPVYITIDLDAFDPAYLPDTGTPEPGGLNWFQVTRLAKMAAERFNVVGFDVVELAAHERSKASDFFSAKLVYKLLTYVLKPATIETIATK